jgi:hypothetical protein
MQRDIDVSFDFRSDTPPGRDPDARSPTLHAYHQLLWSKPLPSGTYFSLRDSRPKGYLHHRSELGEFFLSSDSVVPSFRKEGRLASTFAKIPVEDQSTFLGVTYTIGGMMVFPGNVIDRKMTLNGARGCHPRIKDRFDLTVECIRRHYHGEGSPLGDVITRYASFFGLFENFRGYVDFFLLQDIVNADYSAIRFHAPFKDFHESPLPSDLDAYLSYRHMAMQFIAARNQRIRAWMPPAADARVPE